MRSATEAVRLASPEDAESICTLLVACYGDSFPFVSSLSPTQVASRIREGELVYALALDGERAVGQAALERRGPGGLWELNRAVVADGHRSEGLFGALGDALIGAASTGAAPDVRYIYGYVVTSHPFAQRFGLRRGFATTGLMLGYLPASMVARGIRRPRQATSALVMVRRIERDPPHRSPRLEGRSANRVARAAAALGVPLGLGLRGRLAAATRRGVHVCRDAPLGLTHLRLAGEESTADEVVELARSLRTSGQRLVWVDVPIELPAASSIVERLRAERLTYGAYLPCAGRSGEDVIRLQWCRETSRMTPSEIALIEGVGRLPMEVCVEAGLGRAVPA